MFSPSQDHDLITPAKTFFSTCGASHSLQGLGLGHLWGAVEGMFQLAVIWCLSLPLAGDVPSSAPTFPNSKHSGFPAQSSSLLTPYLCDSRIIFSITLLAVIFDPSSSFPTQTSPHPHFMSHRSQSPQVSEQRGNFPSNTFDSQRQS